MDPIHILLIFLVGQASPGSPCPNGSCGPWPPGHEYIGDTSVAMGYAGHDDIFIESMTTLLTVPDVPSSQGITGINPALENTVILTSMLNLKV